MVKPIKGYDAVNIYAIG